MVEVYVRIAQQDLVWSDRPKSSYEQDQRHGKGTSPEICKRPSTCPSALRYVTRGFASHTAQRPHWSSPAETNSAGTRFVLLP